MGEKGAEIYMRDQLKVPPDKIIYKAPPGQAATQKTFDRVYEKDGVIYVVEAKGGGASLGVANGTGTAKGKIVQQGSREYLEQTIAHMKANPATRDVATKMDAALKANPSTLRYMKVQVPVARTGHPDQLKNLSFGEFQI